MTFWLKWTKKALGVNDKMHDACKRHKEATEALRKALDG